MSAFMVSKQHIDAMVRTALEGPSDNAAPGGYGQQRWYTIYYGPECSKQLRGVEAANEVGEMLTKENLSSINYRYPDTVAQPSGIPGPNEHYWVEEYRYNERKAKRLTIAQAVKAIDCYEYQSCEHPEWHQSEAKEFCEMLRKRLCGVMAGYEDAEWGIN